MLVAQRAGHKNKYLEPREMLCGDQQGDGSHGSTTQTSPDSWDESASIVVSDTIRGRYLMRYKPSSQRGPASLWLAIVNAGEAAVSCKNADGGLFHPPPRPSSALTSYPQVGTITFDS
jgi:hypothetical protein